MKIVKSDEKLWLTPATKKHTFQITSKTKFEHPTIAAYLKLLG